MAKQYAKSIYAAPEDQDIGSPPEYALPESAAYAAPGPGAPYLDSPIGAYSEPLHEDVSGTPDPMRLRHLVQRQDYPYGGQPPQEFFDIRDADDKARHSVETQDADGWTETKGPLKRFAPNPRSVPVPENRPTMQMAPRTYFFMRPMVGGPRALTGEHFSMADHRRNYDILGTQPVRTWRNTYRIDPAPQINAEETDYPPPASADIPMSIVSVDVPPSHNSAFRLV